MSFPLHRLAHSNAEGFAINPLSGDTFVRNMPKYAPAEKLAAELFTRPIPDTLKGAAAFFEDCAHYVKEHTELAECPRFAPTLAKRFDQLRTQLKSCNEGSQALIIAKEARSMVASLTLRMAPAGDEDVRVKRYGSAPGNLPEMMAFFDSAYDFEARSVDPMRPDALAEITQLFCQALADSKARRQKDAFGPSPDALIDAAGKGLSFDTVRRQMVDMQASAGCLQDM